MPQVSKADDITSNLGTDNCRQFRQHVFSELSPIAVDLALRYTKTTERFSYERANQELLEIHAHLQVDDLNLCASLPELKGTAKNCAEKCRTARQRTKNLSKANVACLKIVRHYGLTPPDINEENCEPSLNRMSDWRWWFRKIKILRLRNIEAVARNIALVNRCRSTYASDYTVNLKRKQKENNRLYLSSSFVCNEKGERFSLQQLADRSVSNPANRRAELIVRIKGFEIAAGLLGHAGDFFHHYHTLPNARLLT